MKDWMRKVCRIAGWDSVGASRRRRAACPIPAAIGPDLLDARVLLSVSPASSPALESHATGSLPNFGGVWEILSGLTKSGATITQSGRSVGIDFDVGNIGHVSGQGRIKHNGDLAGRVQLNAFPVSVKAKLLISLNDAEHFQGKVTANLPLLGKKTFQFGGTKSG
ncbi:MAG: hypothetical protein U0903_09625 [Planctomycetales bacterium]